jgi:putative FmdB family regulatory protein
MLARQTERAQRKVQELPLYEYKCQKCNDVFFELRSMADREQPIACPECGGEGEIMFSTFAKGGQSRPEKGSCPMPGGGGPCAGPT